jgi:ABC-type dipeptide/oligopeptide/nickel transport system ATPase subunit
MIARLRNVTKSYRGVHPVTALQNVSLEIAQRQSLMIAGHSGSGKSTLARCLAGWEAVDAGSIELNPQAQVQLIPQDPASSLNPYWTAAQIVAEPFRIRPNALPKSRINSLVEELFRRVGLPPASQKKLSTRFSGGEQALLAIARALAAVTRKPGDSGLLLFDESLSALDVDLRISILEMLAELRTTFQLTLVFLSHDLSVTPRYADTIAVLSAGQLVEHGPTAQILNSPASPHMMDLVAASKGDWT